MYKSREKKKNKGVLFKVIFDENTILQILNTTELVPYGQRTHFLQSYKNSSIIYYPITFYIDSNWLKQNKELLVKIQNQINYIYDNYNFQGNKSER